MCAPAAAAVLYCSLMYLPNCCVYLHGGPTRERGGKVPHVAQHRVLVPIFQETKSHDVNVFCAIVHSRRCVCGGSKIAHHTLRLPYFSVRDGRYWQPKRIRHPLLHAQEHTESWHQAQKG